MPKTTKDKGKPTWTIASHGEPDMHRVSQALSELTYTLLMAEANKKQGIDTDKVEG